MLALRNSCIGLCSAFAQAASTPAAARTALQVAGRAHAPIVLAWLLLITVVACLFGDIGVIVGITGAVLGASMVYCIPVLIYSKARAGAMPKLIYGIVPFGVSDTTVYMRVKCV